MTATQLKRLTQIQLRVRGIRSLLLDKVADELALSGEQQARIQSIAGQTDAHLKSIQDKPQTEDTASTNDQILRAREQEQARIADELTDDQKRRFAALLGPVVDTLKIGQAIAFKAPELSISDAWLNSPPLTLKELRGKVIALHFWAFG